MKAISFIWNSMNEHVNEALNDIKEYAIIEDIISVDFKEDFPNFIRKVYPYTGKDTWKVNYKIENMEKYDNKNITIVFLDIDNEKKIFVERKGIYIYENVEKLKSFIRNKYKNIIDGYAFDNVFHMTDDEEEYKATKDLVIDFILKFYDKNNEIINLDNIIYDKSKYKYLDKTYENGKRNKFFMCDNGLMFKEQTENSFECFAEKYCYELFKKLDIKVAEYYLAKYNNKMGVLTKNFLKENEIFIDGTHIINAYLNYIETGFFNINVPIRYDMPTITRYNNIEDLKIILNTMSKITGIDMSLILSNLKKIFAVDMILLQSDRNSNNWGIIYNRKNKSLDFAPVYDNSNICLFNNTKLIDNLYNLAKTDKTMFMELMYNYSTTVLTEKNSDNYFTPKNKLIEQIQDNEIKNYLKYYIDLIQKEKIGINIPNSKFEYILINAINNNVEFISNTLDNEKKLVK